MIVYVPELNEAEFFRSRVVSDLTKFKPEADVIVANRITGEVKDVDVAEKVHSRDLFGVD